MSAGHGRADQAAILDVDAPAEIWILQRRGLQSQSGDGLDVWISSVGQGLGGCSCGVADMILAPALKFNLPILGHIEPRGSIALEILSGEFSFDRGMHPIEPPASSGYGRAKCRAQGVVRMIT